MGEAEVENVDTLVHNLPGHSAGLLGNSFLSKFKVVLDSVNGKDDTLFHAGNPLPRSTGRVWKGFLGKSVSFLYWSYSIS